MGYSSWKPEFRQGIISRMDAGESARQIAEELDLKRTDVQNLYNDFVKKGRVSQINPAVVIESNEKNIIKFTDEYIQSIWEGFLKQNEAITMKHAYYSPNQNYYIDMCASKWMKDLVKERWITKTPFKDLDETDKKAIGFVIHDIRNYGKQHTKETK